MKTDTATSSIEAVFDVRKMTPEQLAQLGVPDLAYIKPVIMNGTAAFAIHAADGSPMAVATERDMAIAAVVQHEMLPALVH
ncbi:MAG: DUF1150 domain-containing protein [Pseudomonadota bacterium]|nr:DUF1150 domain-containing protein [Pseudomonadota bacterium]